MSSKSQANATHGRPGLAVSAQAVLPVDWRKVGFQAVILGALLAVLYWHVLRVLVQKWMTMPDWSHGFLIPVFSLYYLHMQRHRFPAGLQRTGYLGVLVLLAAFALYVDSTLWHQFSYLHSVSLVIAIFGVVYLVCGWPTARWAWFGVAFLFFALPLPGAIYERMTMPLQQIASVVATLLLNVLPGMDAEAENIVITYLYNGREGALNVEQACSGIRLMMAFVSLGVAMAFVSERPLWHRMVMILSCIPIAIFCNMVRVTTTGLFVVFGRDDLAKGVPHMLLGLSMLLIAFGLFSSISHVLGHLFVEAPAGAAGEPVPATAPQEREA